LCAGWIAPLSDRGDRSAARDATLSA